MGSAWILNGFENKLGSSPSDLQQSSVNADNSHFSHLIPFSKILLRFHSTHLDVCKVLLK